MSEIKLNMRYPESRLEDITDAYMRGFEVGLAMRTDENAELRKERDALDRLTDVLDATNDGLLAENEKLRELVRDMYEMAQCFYVGTGTADDLQEIRDRMMELGVNE